MTLSAGTRVGPYEIVSLLGAGGMWRDADRHFRRAIEIQPNLVIAQADLSFHLSVRQRHDDALRQANEATRVDSLSPFAFAASASGFQVTGHYDDAMRFAARALELHPDFVLALWVTAIAHCRRGDFARALGIANHLVSLSNRAPMFIGLLGHIHASAGRRDDALAQDQELDARRDTEYVVPTADLMIAMARGDRNRIYELFNRCIDEGVNGAVFACWFGPFIDELQL